MGPNSEWIVASEMKLGVKLNTWVKLKVICHLEPENKMSSHIDVMCYVEFLT